VEEDLQQMKKHMTLVALVAASITVTVALAMPVQQRTIEGTYVNPDYGYSVKVPDGLRGENLAPPAPQHGFGIELNGKPGDSIWIDASYDALVLGSADAVANRQAGNLRREHKLVITKFSPTQLAGLEARDIVLENVQQSGSINYIHLVVAFRKQTKGVGIIYTIGIQQKSKNAAGEEAFSNVLRSFQTTPL
jgi:hypothetical protein